MTPDWTYIPCPNPQIAYSLKPKINSTSPLTKRKTVTILVLNAFCRRFITGGDRAPSRYIAQCAVCTVFTIRNTFAHIVFRLSDWYHRVSLNRFNHIQENYDQMVLGRKPYSYIFLEKCFPVKCTLCQYAEFEGSTCSTSENHLLIATLIKVLFLSVLSRNR